MIYHQKDIVEIDFPIPGEGFKVHPALIVSNDELQVDEGFVYVALISSQDFAYSRHYAYPLSDEMLTFKMGKQSYVKYPCCLSCSEGTSLCSTWIRFQTDITPVWTTCDLRCFSPNVPMSLSRRILHALHIVSAFIICSLLLYNRLLLQHDDIID